MDSVLTCCNVCTISPEKSITVRGIIRRTDSSFKVWKSSNKSLRSRLFNTLYTFLCLCGSINTIVYRGSLKKKQVTREHWLDTKLLVSEESRIIIGEYFERNFENFSFKFLRVGVIQPSFLIHIVHLLTFLTQIVKTSRTRVVGIERNIPFTFQVNIVEQK